MVAPRTAQKLPDVGVYELKTVGHSNLQISSALFSPTQRLLVAGGNFHLATMWDLRKKLSAQFKGTQNDLPHVKRHPGEQDKIAMEADVNSVHWSSDGILLVTSCSDKMARIWRFDEISGRFEIDLVKTFSYVLTVSKFNRYAEKYP